MKIGMKSFTIVALAFVIGLAAGNFAISDVTTKLLLLMFKR